MNRMTECDRVRPLLVNLVDATSADVAPGTRDAIRAHVECCRACESALADLVLTGYAVRRAFGSAESVEPPADAWPRLRSRVVRRSPRLGFAGSSLSGLVIGAAVALVLVIPFSVPKPAPKVTQEVGLEVIVTSGVATPAAPAPRLAPASSDNEDRADAHWLMANLQARHAAPPADVVVTPRDQMLPYGELSETDPAVPQSNLPRIQAQ